MKKLFYRGKKLKLRYLEDPKKIFGEEESINTIVRKKLKQEMPEVYRFLDAFSWNPTADYVHNSARCLPKRCFSGIIVGHEQHIFTSE